MCKIDRVVSILKLTACRIGEISLFRIRLHWYGGSKLNVTVRGDDHVSPFTMYHDIT